MAHPVPAAVVALLVVLQFQTISVVAWGADGHHITCLIAEQLLEPAAVKAVENLLPESANGSLTSLCTWADDVKRKSKYRWSSALHYADTPDFLCRYDYHRDCHDSHGHQDVCVSGAINNYTSQLTSLDLLPPSLSAPFLDVDLENRQSYNLTEALLFLAHFVGDIHQPLHVGFTSDGGGNTITVHWYTRKYNLHHVWDNEFIKRATEQFYDSDILIMADAILNNTTSAWADEAQEWAQCADGEISCPDVYAAESIKLACKWAYKGATPGTTLRDEYFLSRLPIVERRLAQGGVRLATILNTLFATQDISHSGSR